ncbi:FIST C-terminal domain-containing protein [Rhodocyclus tenuis]|uniref:FIST C-domain domain-containing protein n=1 Tax=Rhodocyclus tenuis TaxID=1066 RepID=A0A840GLE2_RHOTE|nr:FIST C-terminal domain-containing protein [Rhodocyclus tenuis]MBB4248979.1 hypothetical protein [Rhodocyclus tenuis]
MSIATALISGDEASPQLAEAAVRAALDKAGLASAESVLLFLTPDFARHAQLAVTAAARAASSLQVGGGIAAGVFTEEGWVLDRPAAAAMVFGGGIALSAADDSENTAADNSTRSLLSYTASAFVADWKEHPARFGGSFCGAGGGFEPVVWQGSRICASRRCSLAFSGARVDLGVSSGLRLLAPAQIIDLVCAYDIEEIGGRSALLSLLRALPDALQSAWYASSSPEHLPLPLHHLCAVLIDDSAGGDTQAALAEGRFRPVPIVAVNADDSLTLAERAHPGQRIAWAMREPDTGIADMRRTLARLAAAASEPLAALAFSCIGRGPYFYGGDDEDRALLVKRFPGMPLLGVYGTGQLAPGCDGDNRSLHNCVVTATLSRTKGSTDVQSHA